MADAPIANNGTAEQPSWGKGQLASHTWMEPVMVASILFFAMFINRRKNYSIFGSEKAYALLEEDSLAARLSDDAPTYDPENRDDPEYVYTASKHPPKRRNCCGTVVHTPNSSRFANHFHSRILQKFPFLIEMFYWIVNFGFYACTRAMTEVIFVKEKVWDIAQDHGTGVLTIEHESFFSIFFPIHEVSFQQWFMNGHTSLLTFLNRIYSLIHIPGTVGFIAWYYYVAPNHGTFAIARRTMTLTNFIAFTTFTLWPTMPPRLLPKEYGFYDTVHHENAESVWVQGKYVNSLGAMPSLHFGYAFCIGAGMIYHSGIFRRTLKKGESVKSKIGKILYVAGGIAYPTMVLVVIIATANHYWLDAVAATFVVLLSYMCNRVFLILLPLEDLLLWCLRLEKPIPSTGERFHKRGGRI
ncbi:hypothetical protein M501DRAFT_985847 [Patellaria atrata CBS 101060]|uniref:Inositolphosphotransferase Aur1/Ipt1 domain-containing protein n=1 Tax=Patellaria atrata CBS 101060 TaxID=1346257 RepID=A0A9P4SLD7_9PEZI|nr:hypothetical protein M501DRAFT_985847 [Patellaria atrata CBS 101060]